MLSDEQIMYNVADGDIRQSGLLYERYNVLMYNYFLRTTYDQSLSQDLTQQVFIKIIKYRSTYKNENSFKSWLYRVATNVRNDHYRKEKSLKNRNEKYSSRQDDTYNPLDKMAKSECEQQLHSAIEKLPMDQRQVIWLTRFEKMKYADVAKVMQTTESAIKVKVHRAIKRLRVEYMQLEEM